MPDPVIEHQSNGGIGAGGVLISGRLAEMGDRYDQDDREANAPVKNYSPSIRARHRILNQIDNRLAHERCAARFCWM